MWAFLDVNLLLTNPYFSKEIFKRYLGFWVFIIHDFRTINSSCSYLTQLLQRGDEIVITDEGQGTEHVNGLQREWESDKYYRDQSCTKMWRDVIYTYDTTGWKVHAEMGSSCNIKSTASYDLSVDISAAIKGRYLCVPWLVQQVHHSALNATSSFDVNYSGKWNSESDIWGERFRSDAMQMQYINGSVIKNSWKTQLWDHTSYIFKQGS